MYSVGNYQIGRSAIEDGAAFALAYDNFKGLVGNHLLMGYHGPWQGLERVSEYWSAMLAVSRLHEDDPFVQEKLDECMQDAEQAFDAQTLVALLSPNPRAITQIE